VTIALKPTFYPALSQAVRAERLSPRPGFAQALLMPLIPCGVGACRACAVPTHRGYRLACTEGPFFDLLELEGEEVAALAD